MLEEYGGKVQGHTHSEKALAILDTFKIGDIKEGEEGQSLVVKGNINVDPLKPAQSSNGDSKK